MPQALRERAAVLVHEEHRSSLAYFDKTSVPLTMSTLALVSTPNLHGRTDAHSLLPNWESKHFQAKYGSPETLPGYVECPD